MALNRDQKEVIKMLIATQEENVREYMSVEHGKKGLDEDYATTLAKQSLAVMILTMGGLKQLFVRFWMPPEEVEGMSNKDNEDTLKYLKWGKTSKASSYAVAFAASQGWDLEEELVS